jgi:hypothetical protein
LDAAGAGAEEGLEDHCQGGLLTVHAGVEEADGLALGLVGVSV